MAGATPAGVTHEAGATRGAGAATRAVAILAAATLAEVHLVGDKMTAGGTPRMTN